MSGETSESKPPARVCACGKKPDPGICPADCGPGLPANGHCSCVHQEKTPERTDHVKTEPRNTP